MELLLDFLAYPNVPLGNGQVALCQQDGLIVAASVAGVRPSWMLAADILKRATEHGLVGGGRRLEGHGHNGLGCLSRCWAGRTWGR